MEYIVVGKIINTYGIKGQVKVYPYTDEIGRFSELKNVYLGEKKYKVEIENVKFHKGFVILKFYGFNNINEVLLFKEDLIYIDDKSLRILPENHYFIFDLIDCEVVDISGKKLGYLTDVLQYSPNDVYQVKHKNKEFFIPAVREFIKEVNIEEKKIVVRTIEGMIEWRLMF